MHIGAGPVVLELPELCADVCGIVGAVVAEEEVDGLLLLLVLERVRPVPIVMAYVGMAYVVMASCFCLSLNEFGQWLKKPKSSCRCRVAKHSNMSRR